MSGGGVHGIWLVIHVIYGVNCLIGLQNNKPPNTTTTVIETLEVKMAQVVCSIESKEECVSCGT